MSENALTSEAQSLLLQRTLRGAIVAECDVTCDITDRVTITTLNGQRITIAASEWISEVVVETSDGYGGWK